MGVELLIRSVGATSLPYLVKLRIPFVEAMESDHGG